MIAADVDRVRSHQAYLTIKSETFENVIKLYL